MVTSEPRPRSRALESDLEYEILARLDAAGAPNGCGSLWVELQQIGFAKSPTTIGRVLRLLDLQGYTQRVGYRGRALTSLGERRLTELREIREQADSQALLLESMRPNTVGEMLEVLVARRALEREIARLAGLRATERHIEALWTAIEAQRRALRERGQAVEEDRRFHETLAEASGNRVLAATLRLIRRDVDLQRLLEEIRRGRDSGLVVDHVAITEAVARHDSAGAEQAMLAHIDHLVDDVVSYCRVHPDGFGAHMKSGSDNWTLALPTPT